MKSLAQILNDNSTEEWLAALVAVVMAMLVLLVLRWLILVRLRRMVGATVTLVDDFLVEVVSATRLLLPLAVGLYVGTHFLTLTPGAERFADRAFGVMMALQVGFWAVRGLNFWLRMRFSSGTDPEAGAREMTRTLLSFLGRVALWTLVLLLILDNLGFNVTALVTSLGIGGVAVALAVQNILGDLFASLSIAIDKPFVIGDFIVVGDLTGTVEHVGLKTTRVRSLSGEQIVFSNNDLLKSRIRNYKRMQERRAVFTIGVTYDTPADQIEALPGLSREAIEAQDKVRFDRAHFKAFGPSSLDFEAVYYVLQPDYPVYMDMQQAINLALVRAFAARGIQFAFPTQTLQLSGALQWARAPGGPAEKSA
jgi:small-conductance mechanosensitive channel